MPSPEDLRLAKASRLLRRQAGLTQRDTNSRWLTQEVEGGRSGRLPLEVVRRHFVQFGARAQVDIWWQGAALDRLFDGSHAQVVEYAARTLGRYSFKVMPEYSFNEFGERGSIDLLAGHAESRAVFVGEAKSEWGSLEETLRRQDAKVRLAPKLAKAAFGWQPVALASVLILPNDRTARRVADRHRATLANYSARVTISERGFANHKVRLQRSGL